MQSNIFIRCPWSKIPSNENFITVNQIKTIFNIIVKTFTYKYKYFINKKNDQSDIEKYNLDNIGVFNKFVNEIASGIVDVVAKDYTMNCLREIKNCNLKKDSVYCCFEKLYYLISKNENNMSLFLQLVSLEDKKFIDFLYLFKNCNKIKFDENSNEIKDIETEFNKYKSGILSDIKVVF